MKTQSVLLLCAATVTLASFENIARAQGSFVVNVVNPSFELGTHYDGTPATQVAPEGWTSTAPNFTSGTWVSAADANASQGFYSARIVAGGGGTVLSQEVGLLQNGYDYELTVSVFSPASFPPQASSYSVSLVPVGGTVVSTFAPLTINTWSDRTVTLSAAQIAAENLAGKSLTIRMVSDVIVAPAAWFDNVRLTAVLVPEPAAGSLCAVGCLALFARANRRQKR